MLMFTRFDRFCREIIRRKALPIVLVLGGLVIVGCQPEALPPAPTVIPTITATAPVSSTPLPTSSPVLSLTPVPTLPQAPSATFRPLISVTPAPTTLAMVQATSTPVPTLGPICITAKANDTVFSLLFQSGYNDTSAAPAFRQLNNMAPNSNIITAGEKYCVPRQTATPTPPNYEQTQTSQNAFLPTAGPQVYTEYIVQPNDTTIQIEINTGVALSLMCRLNPLPGGLNCAGCDLSAPIFQAKCRVLVVVGQHIKIPGPTPTPTITPTLSGSETATATPVYSAPHPLFPGSGAAINTDGGQIRLEWLPTRGLLQPDEVYLILLTDMAADGTPRNFQFSTQATSLLIPITTLPADSGAHQVLWLVGVARLAADGSAILISDRSAPQQFTWTR
jgi:hypothetical protein